MSEVDIFDDVKDALGVITDDEDVNKSIRIQVNTVIRYLLNGGASAESIKSGVGIGCVAVGVNDLLNNKAGETKFSPAFMLLSQQVVRG